MRLPSQLRMTKVHRNLTPGARRTRWRPSPSSGCTRRIEKRLKWLFGEAVAKVARSRHTLFRYLSSAPHAVGWTTPDDDVIVHDDTNGATCSYDASRDLKVVVAWHC